MVTTEGVTAHAFVVHVTSSLGAPRRSIAIVARARLRQEGGAAVLDPRGGGMIDADALAPYLPATDVIVSAPNDASARDGARAVEVKILSWPTGGRASIERFVRKAPRDVFAGIRSPDVRLYLEEAHTRARTYLPDTIPWTSFQRASPDERTSWLEGNEIVSVETGSTRDVYPLPHVAVEARLHEDATVPIEIRLALDTVEADVDARTLTLGFRGHIAIDHDGEKGRQRVYVRLSTARNAPPWPAAVAGPSSAPPRFASTMVIEPTSTTPPPKTMPPRTMPPGTVPPGASPDDDAPLRTRLGTLVIDAPPVDPRVVDLPVDTAPPPRPPPPSMSGEKTPARKPRPFDSTIQLDPDQAAAAMKSPTEETAETQPAPDRPFGGTSELADASTTGPASTPFSPTRRRAGQKGWGRK